MDIALCRIDIWSVSTFISGSCAGQLSAFHLAQIGHWNGTKYFINGMFEWTYFSIEPTSKHGRIFVVWAIGGWHNISPPCRKNVGFDEFYGGTQLEDIGRVDHIFIGSRSLNPTAGTRAWGGGLRPLWIETFGINIVNPSANFAVHRTAGFYFVQDTM